MGNAKEEESFKISPPRKCKFLVEHLRAVHESTNSPGPCIALQGKAVEKCVSRSSAGEAQPRDLDTSLQFFPCVVGVTECGEKESSWKDCCRGEADCNSWPCILEEKCILLCMVSFFSKLLVFQLNLGQSVA